MEATGGFEPPNRGFADLRLSPLGYVASNCAGNWAPGPGPIMVPRAGLEPTRAYAHGPLKTACLPIPPPRPVDACRIITYLPGATRFSSPMKLFRADESQWPGTLHSGPRRNPARLTANTGPAWQGTLATGFRRYDGPGQQGNPPILNTFSPIAGQSRLGLAVNYPSTFSSESASPEPDGRAQSPRSRSAGGNRYRAAPLLKPDRTAGIWQTQGAAPKFLDAARIGGACR